MRGETDMPKYVNKSYDLWTWIADRYRSVAEFEPVAMEWWFDRMIPYADQRALCEYAIGHLYAKSEESAAYSFLQKHIWISKKIVGTAVTFGKIAAYRIYNPETLVVEYFCKDMTTENGFAACSSSMAKVIGKDLGEAPIHIDKSNLHQMIGFMAAKEGILKFKSLDIVHDLKHSSTGADCIISSTLGDHHPRIQKLHRGGRTQPDLAPLMLPDAESDYASTTTGKRTQPGHMKDMKHQPICLYMEFLTRLLDARRVMGLRWFLSAIDVVHSDLLAKPKGKK